MKLILKVFRKIGRILNKPFQTIKGNRFLKAVLAVKKEDEVYVFLSDLIGDVVIGMSCMEDYIAANQNKKIVLLTGRDIFAWYPQLKGKCSVMNYDQFHKESKTDVAGRIAFMQSSTASELGLKYGVINTIPCFFDACKKASCPWGMVQVREHIFKVGGTSKITEPIIAKPSEFHYELTDKDIIINPYSYSLRSKEIEIYQKIANICLNKGYNVYTNVLPNQKELVGTKRLDCKLDELYWIAPKAKMVISVRSGVLDFLGFTDANILAVYDGIIGPFKGVYSMKQFNKDTIYEVFLDNFASSQTKESVILKTLDDLGV